MSYKFAWQITHYRQFDTHPQDCGFYFPRFSVKLKWCLVVLCFVEQLCCKFERNCNGCFGHAQRAAGLSLRFVTDYDYVD